MWEILLLLWPCPYLSWVLKWVVYSIFCGLPYSTDFPIYSRFIARSMRRESRKPMEFVTIQAKSRHDLKDCQGGKDKRTKSLGYFHISVSFEVNLFSGSNKLGKQRRYKKYMQLRKIIYGHVLFHIDICSSLKIFITLS